MPQDTYSPVTYTWTHFDIGQVSPNVAYSYDGYTLTWSTTNKDPFYLKYLKP